MTVVVFLSLSVFLFDKALSFFIGFSIKTGYTGNFLIHVSNNEDGNQALIILQDCLRATSYNYKGFSFFSLFPKKIELHHSYIVCRRTAHSFHCTVKKFVVLHLIKDFQFFWIYVMAVCHLA